MENEYIFKRGNSIKIVFLPLEKRCSLKRKNLLLRGSKVFLKVHPFSGDLYVGNEPEVLKFAFRVNKNYQVYPVPLLYSTDSIVSAN